VAFEIQFAESVADQPQALTAAPSVRECSTQSEVSWSTSRSGKRATVSRCGPTPSLLGSCALDLCGCSMMSPRGSPRSFAYWPWARRNAAFFASRARRSSYEEDAARAGVPSVGGVCPELKDEIVVVTTGRRAVAALVPLKNVERETLTLSAHP
jgi:hypothetical protein